ncbi:hypothetical protein DAQ1742_02664 [Dickeya aquatica]|uniref:Uncharacterized protein n=1 Tax=Dickeya aquatica TaxID=1401087 RepID=A0A375AC20_9GAMM|nr:hypothetical protein DAQ1742_02664 [Dickeya aquatica]
MKRFFSIAGAFDAGFAIGFALGLLVAKFAIEYDYLWLNL